jgi:hypothetical protein
MIVTTVVPVPAGAYFAGRCWPVPDWLHGTPRADRHDALYRFRIRVDNRRAALIARRWPFLPRMPEGMRVAGHAADVTTSSSAIRTLAMPLARAEAGHFPAWTDQVIRLTVLT